MALHIPRQTHFARWAKTESFGVDFHVSPFESYVILESNVPHGVFPLFGAFKRAFLSFFTAPRSEIASEFLLFGALHVDVAVLPLGLGGSLRPGGEGWRIVIWGVHKWGYPP